MKSINSSASEVFKDMIDGFTFDNRPVKINTPSNYLLYKLTNSKGKEVYVYWLNSTTPQQFSLGNLGKRRKCYLRRLWKCSKWKSIWAS